MRGDQCTRPLPDLRRTRGRPAVVEQQHAGVQFRHKCSNRIRQEWHLPRMHHDSRACPSAATGIKPSRSSRYSVLENLQQPAFSSTGCSFQAQRNRYLLQILSANEQAACQGHGQARITKVLPVKSHHAVGSVTRTAPDVLECGMARSDQYPALGFLPRAGRQGRHAEQQERGQTDREFHTALSRHGLHGCTPKGSNWSPL